MLVHRPLVSATPVRIHGRSAWLVGQPTPIEFWEGGPNTPWHLEESSSGLKLHHCCFWADDLDAAAERFSWEFLHQSLTKRELGGVALGFAGLALMAWFSSNGQGFQAIGAVLTLVASALWAAGSLASTRLSLPQDPVLDLAAQLVPAGVLLGIWVTASGIAGRTDFASVSLRTWGALVFLVFVSTIIGYAAFLTLNRRASPTLANTFNHVAPVIALLLSAWLLKEPLGWRKLTSAGITLSGVALMVSGSERKPD